MEYTLTRLKPQQTLHMRAGTIFAQSMELSKKSNQWKIQISLCCGRKCWCRWCFSCYSKIRFGLVKHPFNPHYKTMGSIWVRTIYLHNSIADWGWQDQLIRDQCLLQLISSANESDWFKSFPRENQTWGGLKKAQVLRRARWCCSKENPFSNRRKSKQAIIAAEAKET